MTTWPDASERRRSRAAPPRDQADGLRRLFGMSPAATVVVPLLANPHGAAQPRVLDRLAVLMAAQGRRVLVADAASTAPAPHELARVDLGACVVQATPRIGYVAARGLPLAHVDTRGSGGAFIDALLLAAPQADVVLLHADAIDLARLLKHRALRPVLLAADHPESIKHAYAGAKLLARRCELLTFDLLLVASPLSPRVAAITQSLASCLDAYLGAVLRGSALLDTEGPADARACSALALLLAGQLAPNQPDRAASLLVAERRAASVPNPTRAALR